MATRLTFENTSINSSLQIGDKLYYTDQPINGITGKPILAGYVTNILRPEGAIEYTVASQSHIPSVDSFILFAKDIRVNESGLKGYYADVTLVNRSTKRAELFAVSSEITLSSK